MPETHEKRPLAEGAKKGSGFGCLSIFALPFLLIGLGMGFLTAKDAYQWFRVQGWHPVQAELLEAELNISRDDDSDTYRAIARYRYRVNDVDYENDRVGITGGADNIGDYHQRISADLTRRLQTGSAVTVWTNPSNPAESLLNREFRWGMVGFRSVFFIVFGGAGVGMLWAGRYARRKSGETSRLQAAHPNAPWLWRPDWAAGEVLCNNKGIMLFVIIFAVMWNAISLPVLFAVPEALETKQYGILIALLFPLVGIGMATWAWLLYRRYRRFGRSVLRLATIPFQPGGFIDSKLALPPQVYDADHLQLTLNCMRRATSGSGDDRRTTVSSLWQRQFKLRRGELLSAGADGVTVKLLLPADAQETTTIDGSDGRFWQLTAKAELPGVDYAANFEVPVYRTKSGGFIDDGELRSDKPQFNQTGLLLPETVSNQQLAAMGITTGHDEQGWYLNFARFRNRVAALFTLLFTTLWLAISIGMWVFDVSLLFPIVFGLFGVILLAATMDLLVGYSTVRAHRGELLLCRGWFWRRDTLVSAIDIRSIEAGRGMQFGTRLFYRIRLHRHHKSSLTLASGIDGLHVAEQLIDRISKQLDG